MKRSFLVILLLGLVMLVACGSSKPAHYGVFLRQGSSFLEMEQGEGEPPEDRGIPSTSDKQPTIIFWVPDVNIGLLVLTAQVGGIGVAWNEYATQPEVAQVVSGGPADKAGLRPGDLITHVDGVAISTPEEGAKCIRGPIGQPVALTIQRRNEGKAITLTLTRAPISAEEEVKYTVTPKGDGILEIKPRTQLSPGRHCFAAGNPLMPASWIPHWCFDVK